MKDDFEGYLTEFTDEEYLEATWVSMCLTWFEYDDEDECKSWITTDNGQSAIYNPKLHPEKFN